MKCFKSKATTWNVVDDIMITFHEMLDEGFSHAITITPPGYKVSHGGDRSMGWIRLC